MAPATTVRDKLRRCSLDESSLHLQSTCRNERSLCHLARARYAARAKSARFGLHQGINGSKVAYHFSDSVGELAGGLGDNACKRTVRGALLGFLLAASLFTRYCPPAQSQVAAEAGTVVRATNTSESLTNAPAHAVGSFTQLLKRPHRACLGLMATNVLVASAPLACPLHALRVCTLARHSRQLVVSRVDWKSNGHTHNSTPGHLRMLSTPPGRCRVLLLHTNRDREDTLGHH